MRFLNEDGNTVTGGFIQIHVKTGRIMVGSSHKE